jgi:hypothetical protein
MCRPESTAMRSVKALFGIATLEDANELVGNHQTALVGMN